VNQPDGFGFWGWAPDSSSVFLVKVQGDNPREVWRALIDGSAPRKLELKVGPSYGALSVNPDGRHVAFQVQAPSKPEEVGITENFLPASKPGK